MERVHLLRSQPAVHILKHLSKEFGQLGQLDVLIRLAGGVLHLIIFPSGVDLLLQKNHSVSQPVGDHANYGQSEPF
jgi:hypothetical protein